MAILAQDELRRVEGCLLFSLLGGPSVPFSVLWLEPWSPPPGWQAKAPQSVLLSLAGRPPRWGEVRERRRRQRRPDWSCSSFASSPSGSASRCTPPKPTDAKLTDLPTYSHAGQQDWPATSRALYAPTQLERKKSPARRHERLLSQAEADGTTIIDMLHRMQRQMQQGLANIDREVATRLNVEQMRRADSSPGSRPWSRTLPPSRTDATVRLGSQVAPGPRRSRGIGPFFG